MTDLRRATLIALVVSALAKPAAANHCGSLPEDVTTFPIDDTEITRWDLCWEIRRMPNATGTEDRSQVLVIRNAEFRTSPTATALPVLTDGRVSEIFVPYHDGTSRFMDMTEPFQFDLAALNDDDCPGTLYDAAGVVAGTTGVVCREERDRGLAWRTDTAVRRGEAVVLWSILSADNYQYIMEWAFNDDGTIIGRVGMTGPKLNGPDDEEGHMHNVTWRLDIDIGDAANDIVKVTKHKEKGPEGDDSDAFEVDKESGIKWKPKEFTTLLIHDDVLENGNGREVGYELVPTRTGIARHEEKFTKYIFWVTKQSDAELRARDLPEYVKNNKENLSGGEDVVVWYTASAHHEDEMRDEDRDTVPVKWVGFELSPSNVFDGTPLFP